MSTYSVATAKAGLPRLIDRAMSGEEVIITRHGEPVAELRAAQAKPPPVEPAAFYDWLKAPQLRPAGPPITSVELLDEIYDDSVHERLSRTRWRGCR